MRKSVGTRILLPRGVRFRRNGRSSDSGLPLPPPSRLAPVALGDRASPLTAAGPSRTCTGFPYRSPFGRDYHPSVPPSRLSTWLPVLAWAAVIFALSSIAHLGTGLGTWDTILRQAARVTRYEIHVLNRSLDHAEGFARLAHELRSLNESLQAIAYAALGQQGPQVRRRRAG